MIVYVSIFTVFFFFFLVGNVEERPWWPIQSLNYGKRRKRKAKRRERSDQLY